jgi:hypothetical protein
MHACWSQIGDGYLMENDNYKELLVSPSASAIHQQVLAAQSIGNFDPRHGSSRPSWETTWR